EQRSEAACAPLGGHCRTLAHAGVLSEQLALSLLAQRPTPSDTERATCPSLNGEEATTVTRRPARPPRAGSSERFVRQPLERNHVLRRIAGRLPAGRRESAACGLRPARSAGSRA